MFKFKDGVFEPKTKEKIIKDTFFGGAEKDAAKLQQRSIEDAQDITRQSVAEARGDLQNIFPAAQQTARQGFQGGLDVFGQSLPAQTDVFTQGNMGAQQAILQGLPQMQNALFGNQVDYSQLQPFQVQQPDLSFFQQQLPEAINPFAPPPQAQPQQPTQGFGGFQGSMGPGAQNPFSGLQGPMFGGTFGR